MYTPKRKCLADEVVWKKGNKYDVFELCVVKDFPGWKTPGLALRLFKKTVHHSPYYYCKRLDKIRIERKGKIVAHLDGESVTFKKALKIKIVPKALKVVSGKN